MTVAPNLSLGLLSPHNPFDPKAFSGTPWHAARALDRCPDVSLRVLGPHRARPDWTRRLLPDPCPDPAALDLSGLDAVLGLVATPLLAALPADAPPILHATDATPAFLADFYRRTPAPGATAAERALARRAACTIYSSQAMAARAPRDLNLPDLAPAVLPFGINLEALPDRIPEKPSLDRIELLFVGLDWHRKGGDIALASLERLTQAGIHARLTLVGTVPDGIGRHPQLRAVGFLDKGRRRDRTRLTDLYRSAHLLLLPTRGDCTPMVIAEAMAHGTPAIATDTGGVSDLVSAPGAGTLLPIEAGTRDWVRAIRNATADPTTYTLLSDAAFDRARQRFRWDAWAAAIVRLTQEIAGAAVRRHVA